MQSLAERAQSLERLLEALYDRAIVQDGWRVEFLDYDSDRDPPLPLRLHASKGERKVRLAIREWSTE